MSPQIASVPPSRIMPLPVPPAARRFGHLVIAAGSASILWSSWQLWAAPVNSWWLVLLGLTSFSSTFSIRIPNVTTTISVSETFVFLCALLYGPAPAALVLAVDGLAMSFWRGHRHPLQVAFNTTQPALSLWLAAAAYYAAAGHGVGVHIARGLVEIWPIVVFTAVYFVSTTGLNAIIVSLHRGTRFWSVWRQHFGWVLLNHFGAASVAAMLLLQNQTEFRLSTIAIVLPLLAISYLTFKTSLQRVEDARTHLQALNTLYLSTIETLAMAVDAKDQVTHGHIRRVQAYAVGLARAIGVMDTRELQAIEAAALLHDLGKLAIPEHILNKPGKLSAAEFDKMKKHASIGADILSAIEFPYPVVPIVRHHHERWDGKGYPDGLRGADIPIGARILSVVDCFDALTSDRPYRRALSDEQALGMLLADSGTAYDPIVVNTFARVYRHIEPVGLDLGTRAETLRTIAAVAQPDQPPAPATGSASGDSDPSSLALPVLSSLHASAKQGVLADVVSDISHALQQSTPVALCALYVSRSDGLELSLGHAVGRDAHCLDSMCFPKGEKLSGWVAATQHSVCNSDPSLDFIDLDPAPRGLSSCLSVPLTVGDSLVGVLSLYAEAPGAFSDEQRSMVERSARTLALMVRGVLDLEQVRHATVRGALASLPAKPPVVSTTLCTTPTAVIALEFIPTPELNVDAQVARAASTLRRNLRSSDVLYREGASGLLIVLPDVSEKDVRRLAHRVETLVTQSFRVRDDEEGTPVRLGVATVPHDGLSLDVIMQVAAVRAKPEPSTATADLPASQPRLFDRDTRAWDDVA